MNFLNLPLVQFFISGLALGVGFVIPALWPAAFLGVWLFVNAATKSKKFREVIIGGFISWFVKILLVLSWGWSIYPIDWFVVDLPGQGIYGIIFYWLVGGLLLSFGGVILSLVIYALRQASLKKLWIMTPFLWVLAEVTSAYFFSIITWGPGSYLNAAYSYGFLGYLLAEHPVLILLANWGGVYILTIAFVALVGFGVFLFNRFGYVSFLAMVILALGYFVPSPAYTNQGKAVAVVETEFAYGDNREESYKLRREKIIGAIDAALLTEGKYIILPETSQYSNLSLGPEGAYQMFRFQNKDPKVVLVDSGKAFTETGEAIVRATIIDGIEKNAWQFDKQYLVPQGEYLPTLFKGILKILGGREMAETLSDNFNYIPGPISNQGDIPTNLPRVLFCFSSADPTAVRDLVGDDNVPFIAHVTSHAWFRQPTILWQQQTAMLKVQAVWSGVPIVQAANMSPSLVYLPNGTVLRPGVVAEGDYWRVLLTTI